MYIMCPDAFYSQTQSNVTYLAILYHSILKPVFSCSAVQVHPIHLKHMKEIWWCIITCVQNHNLLCVGKSKFIVHCVYTNLMCVGKSEFTLQLCVHKLTNSQKHNVCWDKIYCVLCSCVYTNSLP